MAGFTPVEEVERTLMEPREGVEKVVRDLLWEGWVEKPCITMSMVGLVEVVELMDREQEEEEEEGTLGEAVELVVLINVGVVEALTSMETTGIMNVVITPLVMVKQLLRSWSKQSLSNLMIIA